MPGGQYGTQRGLSYGGANGGQYGDTQFGTRIELREPGHIGPTMSISSQLSVSIGLEHTTVSDMEIDLPPHDMISIDRFRSGEMAYYSDDRLLFSAKIEGVSVASDRTITLSGTASEDVPLTQGEIVRTFSDTTMEQAIEDIGEDLPYDFRVKPASPRPVNNKPVQAADVGTGFEQLLQAGQDIDYQDRSTWRDLPGSYGDDDIIHSLHETTPLRIDIDGLTLTQTCTVLEAQNFDEDNNIPILVDEQASGARCVEFEETEDWVEWSFGLEHTIPAGHTAISIRGRVDTAGGGVDRISIDVNNSTVKNVFTAGTWGTGDYFWANKLVSLGNSLDAGDGPSDTPHTIRLEKIEGSSTVRVDCIAVHDLRFNHDPEGHTDVDENNALAEPGLYPRNCPAVLDIAPTGALLNHATIQDEREWRGTTLHTTNGFLVPATDTVHIVSNRTSRDGEEGTFAFESSIDESAETSHVYAHVDPAGTTLHDENKPTTTPTTFTETQTITDLEFSISGEETALISGEREFSGTPMSVLETMHNDAGRRFAIEHGVGPDAGPPALTSFETRDSNEIRSTANWVVTDVQRDADVSDYANQVTVIGAPLVPGSAARASATARDDSEIEGLRDPPDDNGVRPITIRDESLETVNDALSKARALLRERVNADKRGGSVTTAPVLPTPGPQYLTEFFGDDNVGGWGLDWGQSWGATRIGHHSALESATYSEESGSAQTEMEFEKFSGLYRVVTEI